jgi:hypothetical protein
MEYTEVKKLYPDLDTVNTTMPNSYTELPATAATAPTGEIHIVEGSAHTFRLHKISEIQKQIEQERDKRQTLSKKYHRSVKAINVADNILVGATMGLGVAGIGVLSTIIAAPVAIAMEAAALGTGLLSIIGTQVSRKLSMKAEKHEKIKTLAESKLNTICDHISKALKDNHISDDEFTLIMSELDKFLNMRDEIRMNTKTKIDEETKKSLINQGKEDAMKQFQTMLSKK